MRGAFAVRSLVAVLTAWALLTIVPDLTRPFAPLGTIGLTAGFDGRVIAVDPGGPAARAGVRASTGSKGDRIDFGRTPPATLFALYGGLGGRPLFPLGKSARLDLVERSGVTRAVSLVAVERDPPVAERVSLFVAVIFGIGFVAFGAILAWHFPRRRDVLGFFLFAIWFNPGENYIFYNWLPSAAWPAQETLSAFLQAAGLAGFLTFALRFPTDSSEGWRRPIERALPLFVLFLTVVTMIGSGAEFGRPSITFWRVAFWTKVAIYPLIVAAFLTKLQLLPPVDRQRLRLVIAGCIPGLFFFLAAESVDATSLWQPILDKFNWSPPGVLLICGYLVNALVPISIGYAVLRQRVLPIDFIVNRGLTLGIVWVIVAMSVEATVLATHIFLEQNHVLSTILIAGTFVAITPLLERLKELVNDFVDRFLFVRLHDAKREFEAAARVLAGSSSNLEIEAAIVALPCAKLELASAALFTLADDGAYHLVAQRNWPRSALQMIPPDDAIVALLPRAAREPAARDVLRTRTDMPPGAARPDLVLTLAPNAYVEALVLFSGHTDGSGLTPDERALLTTFARQCGAARAHVLALAMRREIDRLRQELSRMTSSG